ncbi:unnamed protein product, partial [Rotaria sordida]
LRSEIRMASLLSFTSGRTPVDMIKAIQKNFEGLMSLTNLIKEEFSNIEQHIFEEYPILRRTAIECMCNLIVQKEIVKYFIRENDRIKLLILLCSEDDEL